MRLPIILDTDPGIDDAAAIAAALFAPELDLQLMTTVAGNVSVEKTTRNALQLLHFWNADVPLAQGASMPLVRPLRDAASVHGESGMEGYDFVEHQRQPLAKPAFQAIRDALMHAAEPITLVAIGPLTWARRHSRSLLGAPMQLPAKRGLDRRLVGGSLLFGIGWGIAGVCPGPAVAILLTGQWQVILFTVAMLGGMLLFTVLENRRRG